MRLEQSFVVEAPIEQVWAALIDVQRVAPCLPGAEIADADEDGNYSGSFQVKLGPTTASYQGTLKLESLDEEGHVATMRANGRDKRGQGGANATIVSSLTAAGSGTRVEVDTDFTITGRLARFGRGGMIQDISNRLLRDFATCLQEEIARGGDAGGGEAAGGAGAGGAAPAAGGEAGGGSPPGDRKVGEAIAAAAAIGGEETPRGGDSAPAAPAARPSPSKPAERPQAKPVQGLRLLASVLWDRVRRLAASLRARRRG